MSECELPYFPGFNYDKDYYMSSSFYSRYIDDEINRLKNGSTDTEFYYLARTVMLLLLNIRENQFITNELHF